MYSHCNPLKYAVELCEYKAPNFIIYSKVEGFDFTAILTYLNAFGFY